MGLDMYMNKRVYVKNWEHQSSEHKHSITVKKGGKNVSKNYIDVDNISEIVESVAYWRKANAVHSWFVNNVQDGIDNCGEYYVPRSKIEELVDICKQILAESKLVKSKVQNGSQLKDGKWEPIIEDGKTIENPVTAVELLPTTEGFFFGSTDYDQYYYDDIKDTLKQLEPLIEKGKDGDYKVGGDFYYHSSW